MRSPPPQLVHLFHAAGWTGESLGRQSAIPDDHSANEVLEYFDGEVRHELVNELGTKSWETDIQFGHHSTSQIAGKWADRLQVTLICVATFSREYEYRYIAQDGRCFSDNDISEHFSFRGNSCVEAVHNILTLGPRQELLLKGSPAIDGDSRFYDWPNIAVRRED